MFMYCKAEYKCPGSMGANTINDFQCAVHLRMYVINVLCVFQPSNLVDAVTNDCIGDGGDRKLDVCPVTFSLSVFNSPSVDEGEHVANSPDPDPGSPDAVEGSNSRKSSLKQKHSKKLFRRGSTKSKDGSGGTPSPPAGDEDGVDKHSPFDLPSPTHMDSLSPTEEKEDTFKEDTTGENGLEEEMKTKEVEGKKSGKEKGDVGHGERVKEARKEPKRHQAIMRKISGTIMSGLMRLKSTSEVTDPEGINGHGHTHGHSHATDGGEDSKDSGHKDGDTKRGSEPKFDVIDLTSDDVALKPMLRKLSYSDHIWLGMLHTSCRLTRLFTCVWLILICILQVVVLLTSRDSSCCSCFVF